MDHIVDKLNAKHGVTPFEVEEVLWSRPRIRWQERGYRPDEDIYVAYGRTHVGRYLVVVFLVKEEHIALILSARDMDRGERVRYGRK